MCNISIYYCNIRMKHLLHTSKILEVYACNMGFERNISLLFRNGSSLAHGVHRCRARRWRGDRRSGGEEGRCRLAAPRDSHPRLPPTRRGESPSPCLSPTLHMARSHVGLWSHRFLPCARASELLSPCLRAGSWQSNVGSAVVVEDAGRKSTEGPQAGNQTLEAQWLPEGSH